MPKSFSDLLSSGRGIVGTWSQIPSPDVVEILGASGFDFTIVDTEHGHFDLAQAGALIRAAEACGLTPLLRIAKGDAALIGKALDMGVAGVIVPRLAAPRDVADALAAGRYPPDGHRGACPCIRAGAQRVRAWSAYAARANREALIIPLLESRHALEQLDGILDVPGLSVLMMGPFDLSVDLGLGGELTNAALRASIEKAVEAIRSRQKAVIMPVFAPTPEQTAKEIVHWKSRGVNLFTVGTDKMLLADQCAAYRAALA